MIAVKPPFSAGMLWAAASAFAEGTLQGFDPKLGEPAEITPPRRQPGQRSDELIGAAMAEAGRITQARKAAAFSRCLDLAERAQSVRLARAM